MGFLAPTRFMQELGNDSLFGGMSAGALPGSDRDTLHGEDGRDTLDGYYGNDFVDGGIDDDKLYGGNDNDTIYGGYGDDYIQGEGQSDLIFGGEGNDKIYGDVGNPYTEGSDTIFGGGGDDWIDGGSYSNDVIDGGPGNDYLYGGYASGSDTIKGGPGIDYLDGGANPPFYVENSIDIVDYSDTPIGITISLAAGIATFADGTRETMVHFEGAIGGNGPDSIIGTSGPNVLNGGPGNDTVHGNDGDDTVTGGDGADRLYGDAGNDKLILDFTPAAYGALSASDQATVSQYVAAPAGKVLTLSTGLRAEQFETAELHITDPSHFDPLYYLEHNPDVAAAEIDPLTHYRNWGWAEGRDPSPEVDLASVDGLEYIASYSDLIAAFGLNKAAGYQHFATQGLFEGRTTSFDGLEYIASYGDLINAFHTQVAADPDHDIGTSHYIVAGYAEQRAPDLFDAAQYLANYADLQTAFGTNLAAATLHYITSGYFESRTDDAPLFATPNLFA